MTYGDMKVKVLEGGRMPTRAHVGDAGFDLYVVGDYVVRPGEFVDIPCGVAVELPAWCWGLLTGRSSTIRSKGLHMAQGVIDNGYRGPLFAGCWNLGDEPVEVHDGERVAQLIPLPLFTGVAVEVADLTRHERGVQGFGSSGR